MPPVHSPKGKKTQKQTDWIGPSTSAWSLSFNWKEKQSLQSDKATQEWLQLFPLNEPERTDGVLTYCHRGQS